MYLTFFLYFIVFVWLLFSFIYFLKFFFCSFLIFNFSFFHLILFIWLFLFFHVFIELHFFTFFLVVLFYLFNDLFLSFVFGFIYLIFFLYWWISPSSRLCSWRCQKCQKSCCCTVGLGCVWLLTEVQGTWLIRLSFTVSDSTDRSVWGFWLYLVSARSGQQCSLSNVSWVGLKDTEWVCESEFVESFKL